MKTTKPFLLAPSLLAADLSRLGEEMIALETAWADLFHFDIMDGHFVPNISFGLPVIESVRKVSKLPFDAHLMISNADAYLEEFARVGCNWLSVHVEACSHLNGTLSKIRSLGMKPGVAINPGTSLASVDAVLDLVDFVLIMSVNPGFGGQSFIQDALERVQHLRTILRPDQRIQIDGGIKQDNIAQIVRSGADVIVMGTGLLAADNYSARIEALRKAATP